MKRIRVIPLLLIQNGKLVKGTKFKNHRYVGDPINAVRIFNEKEVDELSIIDISASKMNRRPNIGQIREIAGEAFMPLSYGGGITSIDEVKEIFFNGIEKVLVNKTAITDPQFITKVADKFGTQSIVICMDVKKNIWGKYKVFSDNGTHNTDLDPVEYAQKCEMLGAGEILLTSVDREGSYAGYGIDILKKVTDAVSIPVIAAGGAGEAGDFKKAVDGGGASAVAAGSMFVFKRPHNAVLISYPSQKELSENLYKPLGNVS